LFGSLITENSLKESVPSALAGEVGFVCTHHLFGRLRGKLGWKFQSMKWCLVNTSLASASLVGKE
jgi:hypothetical protein